MKPKITYYTKALWHFICEFLKDMVIFSFVLIPLASWVVFGPIQMVIYCLEDGRLSFINTLLIIWIWKPTLVLIGIELKEKAKKLEENSLAEQNLHS